MSLDLVLDPNTANSLSSFVKKHKTIETLRWDVRCTGFEWSSNVIPRLKVFSGSFADTKLALGAPSDVLRPLEFIQSIELDESFWIDIFTKLDASKMRKLSIHIHEFSSTEEILRLTREFSGLVSLSVNISTVSRESAAGKYLTKV